MGIYPREARQLTLWEYEATLVNWNKAHAPETDVEPADVDQFRMTEQFFDLHPELLN